MKTSTIEVSEHFLQERRDRGQDRRDEMWEGVLHLVPQPISRHQHLQMELGLKLHPAAEALGLFAFSEAATYRPGFEDTNYRVPDLVFMDAGAVAHRGVAGPPLLVIEIRSPGDESYAKVPFYVEQGALDILILDRDTLRLELWVRGEKQAAAEGYDLESLGVRIERTDGPRLAITWPGTTTVITPLDV